MRLKVGTSTGMHDITGEDILVGQNVLADGAYYYCNSYLQAVPYGDGKAVKLSELVRKADCTEIVAELPKEYKQIGEVCPCKGMGGKKMKAAAEPPLGKDETKAAEKAVEKESLERESEEDEIEIVEEEEIMKESRDIEREILEGETAIEQVNHPAHYNSYGIETIDMMVRIWGAEKVADWCELTAFKYRMRMGTKTGNPVQQDLEKEAWYISKSRELRG